MIYASPFVPWVVLFAAGGIYFTNNHGESFEQGLWWISAQGGQPRLIDSTIWQPVVANGAAWGLGFNAADPSPAPGGIGSAHNTILRFDLNTGASQVWWYRPGNDMLLLDGDYSGNLFVATYDERVDGSLIDWSLDHVGTASGIGTANLGRLAAVDSNGVWFPDGSSPSLWLYAAGRLQRIADFNVQAVNIGGGCIPGS